MSQSVFDTIRAGLTSGEVVPYLGAGALSDVTEVGGDAPIPADSDSLIYAMNDGKPMSPKLMYEFPRAAMNQELKKGRSFVTRFLNRTYQERQWTRSALHDWLAALRPNYVIDVNRDLQLQDSYKDTPHVLIRGTARLGGTDYRFVIHQYDGSEYTEVQQGDVDTGLPILFKPLGSPLPTPTYIASDADFVDYITELMGGFAIPRFLKEYRREKRYVLLGLRLQRDTERMVLSDVMYGAAPGPTGWALIPEPTEKERRFCARKGLELVEADWTDLLPEGETKREEDLVCA